MTELEEKIIKGQDMLESCRERSEILDRDFDDTEAVLKINDLYLRKTIECKEKIKKLCNCLSEDMIQEEWSIEGKLYIRSQENSEIQDTIFSCLNPDYPKERSEVYIYSRDNIEEAYKEITREEENLFEVFIGEEKIYVCKALYYIKEVHNFSWPDIIKATNITTDVTFSF